MLPSNSLSTNSWTRTKHSDWMLTERSRTWIDGQTTGNIRKPQLMGHLTQKAWTSVPLCAIFVPVPVPVTQTLCFLFPWLTTLCTQPWPSLVPWWGAMLLTPMSLLWYSQHTFSRRRTSERNCATPITRLSRTLSHLSSTTATYYTG